MLNSTVWMLHDIRDKYNPRYTKRYTMPYFMNVSRFLRGLEIARTKGDLAALSKSRYDYLESDKPEQVLTFDDGLKDHLEVGRILADKGIAGVFFVPSGIFDGHFVDSHKIQFINSVLADGFVVNFIKQELNFDGDDWDELYLNLSTSLWKTNIWPKEKIFMTRFFRSYHNITLRREILDSLFMQYVVSEDKHLHKDFYMTERDARELLRLGHQVGGHGVLSYNLEFESPETIHSELAGSKEFLESLDLPLQYALANGGFSSGVLNEAKRLGFKKCYTTSDDFLIESNTILHGRKDFTKEY